MERVIADIEWNRDQDKAISGERIIRIYASNNKIYICFEMGKNENDTCTLTLPLSDFMSKMVLAIAEQEVTDE